ncbi:MAG: hypothetical protein EOO38_12910 [Cytophagaceae bacterium]|nr:MAG: hypothetical protein EOO38_12910 [Cytophagaceae bacterium]
MESPITLPVADEVRHWQVGDLFTLGTSTERKLVVNVTEEHIEVIAQTGWYNRYEHRPHLPVTYLGRPPFQYDYRGRAQLNRDFVAGTFTLAMCNFLPLNGSLDVKNNPLIYPQATDSMAGSGPATTEGSGSD